MFIHFNTLKLQLQSTNRRENRAYDAKVTYFNKTFDHKFIEYLGPTHTYFNTLPINIKNNIYTNYRDQKRNLNKIIIN